MVCPGINALTISCRCAAAPEGVSPACHLGDGSTDLVLVYDASRIDYLRHLIRITAKSGRQVIHSVTAGLSQAISPVDPGLYLTLPPKLLNNPIRFF